uniref:Putative LAGLIDADG homing endonuclease n=1 Tax=Jenufa minuta TaxID=993092 RepID=A0A0S2LNG4_JENMI|nr:putative LAGLIDADG homing endonuclease [Jenufa minuta]YP_009184935.1 putative LAGLIDADG homing endonuclease [Jenufa minuta]ALO63013.1 putative LAGLIDADG homing endonuclease [Jenufa minuta]ALO63016.1 putative LAGLIDADG homing endonuclease [Jenufa minuta]
MYWRITWSCWFSCLVYGWCNLHYKVEDGGKAQNTPRAAYINVTNFTDYGRVKLQQMLKEVFGLKINIHKAGGNNQYNFYILFTPPKGGAADSYELFYRLVLPTVDLVPAMRYKLAEKIRKKEEFK